MSEARSVDMDALDWGKGDGLLPAVVQDAGTRQVLMLGYMNREALAKTLACGEVTFFSRSKGRLWTKGESSGHVLKLQSISADCDADTLLVLATPVGPTCHLGTTSCFGGEHAPGIGFLAELERIVSLRAGASPEESYTARLAMAGVKRVAQKVGEEGVETALAAVAGDKTELASEAADLLYHLLVLLNLSDLRLQEVLDVLRGRHRP